MSSVKNRVFTSESVTEGHPDKICDRLRTRCWTPYWPRTSSPGSLRCAVTTGMVIVMGEISTEVLCGHPSIVRNTVRK